MFTFFAFWYIIACIAVSFFAEKKGYDYWKSFIMIYLLTPFVFLVYMAVDKYVSDKKNDNKQMLND